MKTHRTLKKKSFILFTSTENEHYEQILKMTMCNSRLIKEQFSIHLQLIFPAMFDIKNIFFQKVTVTEILKNNRSILIPKFLSFQNVSLN